MNPGEMRHRVKAQKEIITVADDGSVSRTWTDSFEMWCKIESQGISETQQDKQTRRIHRYKITAWYNEELTTEFRIMYGNRIIKLETIAIIDEVPAWMELEGREETNL